MLSLYSCIGLGLRWTQPVAMRGDHELRADDRLAATLRFRSSLGSLATAGSADGCWTFKRVGFWQPRVTVRGGEGDRDLAVFRNGTWSSGGSLELPDGRVFPVSTNCWATRFELRDDRGGLLIRYSRIGGILHTSAQVEIEPAAAALPELPWLVPLGWYLAILMQHDAAAMAATTASLC